MDQQTFSEIIEHGSLKRVTAVIDNTDDNISSEFEKEAREVGSGCADNSAGAGSGCAELAVEVKEE